MRALESVSGAVGDARRATRWDQCRDQIMYCHVHAIPDASEPKTLFFFEIRRVHARAAHRTGKNRPQTRLIRPPRHSPGLTQTRLHEQETEAHSRTSSLLSSPRPLLVLDPIRPQPAQSTSIPLVLCCHVHCPICCPIILHSGL